MSEPFAFIWGHIQVSEDMCPTPTQGMTFRGPISVMIKATVTASVPERLVRRQTRREAELGPQRSWPVAAG